VKSTSPGIEDTHIARTCRAELPRRTCTATTRSWSVKRVWLASVGSCRSAIFYDFPGTVLRHAAKDAGWFVRRETLRSCVSGMAGASDATRPHRVAGRGCGLGQGATELQLTVGDLVVRRLYGTGDHTDWPWLWLHLKDLPAAASELIVIWPRVALTLPPAAVTEQVCQGRQTLGQYESRLNTGPHRAYHG
jgi:hypothetical protein